MSKQKVAIIGYGKVGRAYHKMFPEAVIYDEPQLVEDYGPRSSRAIASAIKSQRDQVNACQLALVCVPTNLKDKQLDMSIVEDVISWLDTPLILIKSALQPGTVDRLVKETGKKIAVSIEFVGEGSYHVPSHLYPDTKNPTKHQMLIIGGELETATKCAEILWARMSPTIRIHLVSALEAEIGKLVENTYAAVKVTWINTLLSLTQKTDTNFIRIHQGWTADGRVDGMHQRAVSFNKGWASKCWDKDIPALMHYAKKVGAEDMYQLLKTVTDLNKKHLEENRDTP